MVSQNILLHFTYSTFKGSQPSKGHFPVSQTGSFKALACIKRSLCHKIPGECFYCYFFMALIGLYYFLFDTNEGKNP